MIPLHSKACARCRAVYPRCSGFARWDTLCIGCRKTVGPRKSTKPKRSGGFPEEDWFAIASLRADGLNAEEIGALFGVSRHVVNGCFERLRGLGYEPPPIRKRGRGITVNRERVLEVVA